MLVIGAGPTGLGAAKRLNQIVSILVRIVIVDMMADMRIEWSIMAHY